MKMSIIPNKIAICYVYCILFTNKFESPDSKEEAV